MESESTEITLTGNITYEDFKLHNSYHIRNYLIGNFIIQVIILSAIFVLLFYKIGLFLSLIFGYSIFVAWITIILSSLLIASFIAVPLILILRFILLIRVRKEYQSNTLIRHDVSYLISEQRIHQKRGSSNTYFEWGDIFKAYEHKKMFRLYVSRNNAILLPKRFFKTNKGIKLFKKMVHKNLDDRSVIMK
ncbi:MAG: YcxB family protein [Bacillota bacterium]